MERLLFLLALALIFITGCENSQENYENLYLEYQLDQLGEESFTNEGLNNDTHIAEKDGFTYIITPISELGDSLRLIVSILENNNFKIKEKEIDVSLLMDSRWNTDDRSYSYDFSENNILLYTEYGLSERYFHSINIDQSGNASLRFLNKTESRGEMDSYTFFIEGLRGTYFEECFDNNCNLFNFEGNSIYTYEDKWKSLFPTSISLFFDEANGFYYLSNLGNYHNAFAFDTTSNAVVWDLNGAQKEFNFPSNINHQYVGGSNGFYIASRTSNKVNNLYFYNTTNNEVTLSSESLLQSNLDIMQTRVTLDNYYFNVYNIVQYQGKPTIQKYSYKRVDFVDSRKDELLQTPEEEPASNIKEDVSEVNQSNLTSYDGVWVHYFTEGDENSGGYFITLTQRADSKETFDVDIKEMTPGATFINGSESTIGLGTGLGVYEFMWDANDNSGMVEIELAGDEIIYRKTMYTTNPGRFNEDLEISLTKKQ
ncbi:hypothetical protein [Bacillus alkalicellulosilyticus]|uniref:hypothetical protein n=1 Tax=Alkalihalobacterium alkalicellulosilyticum TaxID=1912214 RepID=UPI0009962B89|nr:hypothetical protein [Bacillus alkalicellulosilyticus]